MYRTKSSWEYVFVLLKFTTTSPLTIEDGFKTLCHLITPQPPKRRLASSTELQQQQQQQQQQQPSSQEQSSPRPQLHSRSSTEFTQPLPETFVTQENFNVIVELVSSFAKSENSPVALAMKSTELFLTLHSLVSKILRTSANINVSVNINSTDTTPLMPPPQPLTDSSPLNDNRNPPTVPSPTPYKEFDEKKGPASFSSSRSLFYLFKLLIFSLALLHFWIPVLQQLLSLCCHDRRWEVQSRAVMMLQRALLLDHLKVLSPDGWSLVFEQVTPSRFYTTKEKRKKNNSCSID
jgi:hypothetical protein